MLFTDADVVVLAPSAVLPAIDAFAPSPIATAPLAVAFVLAPKATAPVPAVQTADCAPIATASVPADCAPLTALPPIATAPLPEAVTAFATDKTFPLAVPVAVPPNATAFCPVDWLP